MSKKSKSKEPAAEAPAPAAEVVPEPIVEETPVAPAPVPDTPETFFVGQLVEQIVPSGASSLVGIVEALDEGGRVFTLLPALRRSHDGVYARIADPVQPVQVRLAHYFDFRV